MRLFKRKRELLHKDIDKIIDYRDRIFKVQRKCLVLDTIMHINSRSKLDKERLELRSIFNECAKMIEIENCELKALGVV